MPGASELWVENSPPPLPGALACFPLDLATKWRQHVAAGVSPRSPSNLATKATKWRQQALSSPAVATSWLVWIAPGIAVYICPNSGKTDPIRLNSSLLSVSARLPNARNLTDRLRQIGLSYGSRCVKGAIDGSQPRLSHPRVGQVRRFRRPAHFFPHPPRLLPPFAFSGPEHCPGPFFCAWPEQKRHVAA